jgi:hypothetical protein
MGYYRVPVVCLEKDLGMSLNDYLKCPGPDRSVASINDSRLEEDRSDRNLKELLQLACRSGASGARIIPLSDISVEDDLTNFCREPRCENYGLSASCPPHVSGPSGFREFQKNFKHALVIKIDVPSAILLSDERRDIMKLLHEIVAGIE